jgi:hypothetical protein
VSSPDHAGNTINLIAAAMNALRLIEHTIFGEDLVDCRAPPHGIAFTEDVVEIAEQQSRNGIWHGLVLQNCRRLVKIEARISGKQLRRVSVAQVANQIYERDGLITRTVFPTIPPRVEYDLTKLGHSLLEPITGLEMGGEQPREDSERSNSIRFAETNQTARLEATGLTALRALPILLRLRRAFRG